ncbi:hypothetical protein KCU65_g6584, partial [Aureobasidium melanogenum]
MSITRPRPRPTMHADLPNKWLWCDNHSQVNKWHMNVPSRPRYNTLISSFINHANRAWEKAIDAQGKLSSIERTIVDCLLNDPIPADVMIATMQDYNHFVGGTKGELKQTGLIPWDDEAPTDAAIQQATDHLYKYIEKTLNKYYDAEAARGPTNTKSKGKNKGKGKANGHVNNKAQEDVEMQDADMEEQDTMPSLNDMKTEITAAGNAPTAVKDKGKGKAPVQFGKLPLVGGKKEEKDDDKEWKDFFLG